MFSLQIPYNLIILISLLISFKNTIIYVRQINYLCETLIFGREPSTFQTSICPFLHFFISKKERNLLYLMIKICNLYGTDI